MLNFSYVLKSKRNNQFLQFLFLKIWLIMHREFPGWQEFRRGTDSIQSPRKILQWQDIWFIHLHGQGQSESEGSQCKSPHRQIQEEGLMLLMAMLMFLGLVHHPRCKVQVSSEAQSHIPLCSLQGQNDVWLKRIKVDLHQSLRRSRKGEDFVAWCRIPKLQAFLFGKNCTFDIKQTLKIKMRVTTWFHNNDVTRGVCLGY